MASVRIRVHLGLEFASVSFVLFVVSFPPAAHLPLSALRFPLPPPACFPLSAFCSRLLPAVYFLLLSTCFFSPLNIVLHHDKEHFENRQLAGGHF